MSRNAKRPYGICPVCEAEVAEPEDIEEGWYENEAGDSIYNILFNFYCESCNERFCQSIDFTRDIKVDTEWAWTEND